MKTALRILIEIALFALLVFFGVRWYLGRSVPQRDGSVHAPVAAAVEITFDARGVPQIWAQSDADAFFAIGWLHASDRLFQMEMTRRLARGELSEVFGPLAFETDVMQRRLGFARRVDPGALTPPARTALERYAAGVNAWVAATDVLPFEFVLLRIRPRPWTVEDCLAISDYQTWFAHNLMDQDPNYQKLVAALGDEGRALTHAGHPWSPTTVPAPTAPAGIAAGSTFVDDLFGASGLRMTTASNSWAVSPSKSTTGKALHASDPHLAVDQIPGLWYLAGLHSAEGLNVLGATFPGLPFVIMGHNDAIAFSFTVAAVDLVDYFEDRPVRGRRELVCVKGEKEPRAVEVKEGTRSVMVGEKTSLRWAGFDFRPSGIVDAGLRLQKARTFGDFRHAVTGMGALDANWVYSDRAGSIGYQLGAPIPIRDYDPFVKQPAADARTVWRGYVPLDETPSAFNPLQGFLASCNNRIASNPGAPDVPGFYDPYRIVRANALLQGTHSPADLRRMQLDLVSGIALRWKKLAAEGARAAGLPGRARELETWDGRMSADSRAGALFQAWWRSMPRAVFEDDLGSEWRTGRGVLDAALTAGSPLIDDKRTAAKESITDISARAMKEAEGIAQEKSWGEISRLEIRHPLDRVKALNFWFRLSRGPFPAAGDAGSLDANFTSFDEKSNAFRSRVGPSMRFVLDWADVDSFTLTGVFGQSGNPFSEHYDDFLEISRRGESWVVPFSRSKVYAAKKSLLRIEPGT